jgi:arginine/lysine/ornithine decarboxylase
LAVDPATGASLPAVTEPAPAQEELASVLNQTVLSPAPAATAPFTAPPVDESPAVPEAVATTPVPDTASAPEPAETPSTDALLSLKQQALSQLSPLVGHLDQSPEERFRTTMMLIQSTDNNTLLQTAYDAAQAITDEKIRAQALLDVINEINYFTQQSQQSSDNS